ncbi:M35 family metallo-endopeptidase [Dyella sp. GSA-30]|uniref:M35 family metallo-endopeptidase n=1 Tax=Dyella sp. GSA-30 TaxID=2994496 RepID=UPI00248F8C47|nr:M35 family metallo-endopeptidase [Dyella sp. GSA-30]BDU19338.1 peptidase M35 [Dyella sp. GSA-30]
MKKVFLSACVVSALALTNVALAGIVDIELKADTSLGAAASSITVTATNRGDVEERISRWDLPIEFEGSLGAPLLDVTHDGQPVDYIGKLVKRADGDESDLIRLASGQAIAMKVDVAHAYDLTQGGRFEVRYKADDTQVSRKRATTGNAIIIDVAPSMPKFAAAAFNQVAAGDTQFRSCTADQTRAIQGARRAAGQMINGAHSAMSRTSAGNRYRYWFGNHDNQRYASVKDKVGKIKLAVDNAGITVDCGCSDRGIYAYVYPNRPYDIYVCGAFWSAPEAGTDSRGGTLVHELSHFTIVAGTQDHAYGQTAARQLAQNDPARAIANADNYEYFSENTPNHD